MYKQNKKSNLFEKIITRKTLRISGTLYIISIGILAKKSFFLFITYSVSLKISLMNTIK